MTNIKREIYQTDNGAIVVLTDKSSDTVWASQKQIADIFGIDRSVVSRHIKNIFKDEELDEKVVSAKFAQTTQHGAIKGKQQTKQVEYYQLDIILAVGYRTNSARAIQFRKWATATLKKYIVDGYAINQKRIAENQQQFLQTLDDLKALTNDSNNLETTDILSLIQAFSDTWFTLDSYDRQAFPTHGNTDTIEANAEELQADLETLKYELIDKGEASPLFAQEKKSGTLSGIFGNVFQSLFGEDAYATIEEKAAHLLYFIIKNHPFNDGNKRSGAFAFIWLLQKYGYNFRDRVNPQTLTTLTILIAESNPADKDKIIGVVKLLLNSTEFE